MKSTTHRFYEDLFALFSAGIFVAFGVHLFQAQDLMIGGAAGLALLGTHALDYRFGEVFFVINIPFYWLAWTQISKRFTINTFVSVTTISVMTEQVGRFVDISHVDPIFAAVLGGLMIGTGILMMFRHSSSLGGLGILGYYVQARFGVRAGTFQLAVDSIILLTALIFISSYLVTLSILAALCLNLVISLNHRPDRYVLRHAKASLKERHS